MKYMYIAIYVLILDSVTFLIKNSSFTSHYLVVVFSLVSADYCRHFPSLAGQLQLIHSCLHSWAISVVLRKLGTWKRVLWILKIENSQLSGKHFVWRNILFQRWLHTPKSSLVLLAWKLPRTQPTPSEFFTGQASLAKCHSNNVLFQHWFELMWWLQSSSWFLWNNAVNCSLVNQKSNMDLNNSKHDFSGENNSKEFYF